MPHHHEDGLFTKIIILSFFAFILHDYTTSAFTFHPLTVSGTKSFILTTSKTFSVPLPRSNRLPTSTMSTALSKGADLSIRVVSYNVLSSKLASPWHHIKSDPKYLKKSYRLPKILKKIGDELSMGQKKGIPVIFCLQEVSLEWVGEFHTFFAQHRYSFIPALYGGKFNGYMGIATAYPLDRFETLQVDVSRLADTFDVPIPPSSALGFLLDPVKRKMDSVMSLFWQKKKNDPWGYSKNRYNQFIAIRLKDTSKNAVPFWIGNYHMPCAYWDPPVMNIHAELVAKRIQTLAMSDESKDEYILAGDFNIIPSSPHYKLFTEGVINKNDTTYPPPKFGVEWIPKISLMRSAYALHNGEEPEFTNFAHTKDNESAFTETLDYIFLSEGWKVTNVRNLPRVEDANGPYPNASEPSDHVVIAANLML